MFTGDYIMYFLIFLIFATFTMVFFVHNTKYYTHVITIYMIASRRWYRAFRVFRFLPLCGPPHTTLVTPPHALFVVVAVIDHILGSNRARSSHGLFVIKRDRPNSYDEKIHVLLQYITRTHGFLSTRFALLFYSFLFSSPFPLPHFHRPRVRIKMYARGLRALACKYLEKRIKEKKKRIHRSRRHTREYVYQTCVARFSRQQR